MDTRDLSVLVVGGGIGGLTCALSFANRGAQVTLFEQAADFTEVGAGIQITPNAARVLAHLNLAQYLPRIGVVSDAVVPMDGLSGAVVTRFDLRHQTPRYHFVHRARLVDLLAGACQERGVSIHLGCRIMSATRDGQVTYVDARTPETVQTAAADIVVFADGLHSIGRTLINGAADPFFTGQVAWRAVVDARMPAEARIAMAPGRHLVTYPINATQVNIVAVQERDTWAEEGWNHADDPQNMRAAFSDFHDDFKALLDDVDAVNLWGLFRHDVAPRWAAGAMFLVGDAAHPTLPFLAQGANLAMEDAFVLARALSEQRSIQAAGKRYQQLRNDRVVRAIATANANAVNYHLSGVRRRLALTGLRAIGSVAPNAFLNRLSWLYDHDVTA